QWSRIELRTSPAASPPLGVLASAIVVRPHGRRSHMSVNVKLALFMLVVLVPSLAIHEYAHAWAAVRQGDQSPRRSGRLTLNLKPHVDKFGTLLLPALLLLLVGSGYLLPVFAYAKPMPVNPGAMRNAERG